MTYELAKELKDAGFPQEDSLYIFAPNTIQTFRSHFVPKPWIACPTLSELIEACGNDIAYVSKDRYGGLYSGAKWLAYDWLLYDDYGIDGDDVACMEFWRDNKEPIGKGVTPEEAVARLWLALNKKV